MDCLAKLPNSRSRAEILSVAAVSNVTVVNPGNCAVAFPDSLPGKCLLHAHRKLHAHRELHTSGLRMPPNRRHLRQAVKPRLWTRFDVKCLKSRCLSAGRVQDLLLDSDAVWCSLLAGETFQARDAVRLEGQAGWPGRLPATQAPRWMILSCASDIHGIEFLPKA